MAKVAVILSGCGVYDGSEIHEAVLTYLHLREKGANVIFAAPDIEQTHTIDHQTGQEDEEASRNVMREAARIARGNIHPLYDLHSSDIDAVIFPGGFGAAKNLSDYAFRDNTDDMAVQLYVEGLIQEMHAAKKPMGFWCITPVCLAAVALKGKGLKMTLGHDTTTSDIRDSIRNAEVQETNPIIHLRELSHTHVDAAPDEVVVDEENKVVTTPAYMTAVDIVQVNRGIEKAVDAVMKLVHDEVHVDEPGTVSEIPEDVAI